MLVESKQKCLLEMWDQCLLHLHILHQAYYKNQLLNIQDHFALLYYPPLALLCLLSVLLSVSGSHHVHFLTYLWMYIHLYRCVIG